MNTADMRVPDDINKLSFDWLQIMESLIDKYKDVLFNWGCVIDIIDPLREIIPTARAFVDFLESKSELMEKMLLEEKAKGSKNSEG